MPVVVETDCSLTPAAAEFQRHQEILSLFLQRLAADSAEDRSIRMILRAPSSAAAEALVSMTEELVRAGVVAQVVLGLLEPDESARHLFASLSRLASPDRRDQLLRWARNPRLLDAHEQVTYGSRMCWSGGAMRRDPNRNALSLFHDENPQTARLGQLAFEALWSASTEVPERKLLGAGQQRPSGAYEPLDEAQVAVSPLRPILQGWPLVRH